MLSTGNNNKKDISSFVLLSRFGSGNYIYYRYLDIDKWTNQTAFIDGRNVVVQSLRHVQLFVTPWIAAQQSSLSLNISWSLLNLMSIESVVHPTISSSVVPFSSCIQSFPASGSFPTSRLFTSGGQSIGASASASALPMNNQDWFSLGLTVWSPCSPRDYWMVSTYSAENGYWEWVVMVPYFCPMY